MQWNQDNFPTAFEIVLNPKGHIALAKANEGSNPELTFGEAGRDLSETEIRSLWATMIAASESENKPISTEHLVLFTDKFQENGRLIAETAALTKPGSDWGVAYEPFQVKRHNAFALEMHAKYAKPQLWVLAAPRPSKSGKVTKAPPAKLNVKRIEAPSVQSVPQTRKGQGMRRQG